MTLADYLATGFAMGPSVVVALVHRWQDKTGMRSPRLGHPRSGRRNGRTLKISWRRTMKTRILALVILALLLAPAINAELSYLSVSATTTSQYVAVGTSSLTVVNDGASNAYIRVFWEGETIVDSNGNYLAATSANALIKSGESLEFSRQLQIKGIAILSASTSTVRLFYW